MYFSRIRLKPGLSHSSSLHRLIQGNGYGVHQLLWELFPGLKQRPFVYREEIAGEQTRDRSGIKGEPIYYLVSHHEPLKESPLFTAETKAYSPRLKTGDRLSFKLRANPVVARKAAGKKNSVKHDIVMDAQRSLLKEIGETMGLACKANKSALKREILAAWKTSGDHGVTSRLISVISDNERFAGHPIHTGNPERLLYWAMKAATDNALEQWLSEKGLKNGFELFRNERNGLLHFQAESYRWHALPRKGKSAGFSSIDFEGMLTVRDPGEFINALSNGIGPSKGFGCGLIMVRK